MCSLSLPHAVSLWQRGTEDFFLLLFLSCNSFPSRAADAFPESVTSGQSVLYLLPVLSLFPLPGPALQRQALDSFCQAVIFSFPSFLCCVVLLCFLSMQAAYVTHRYIRLHPSAMTSFYQAQQTVSHHTADLRFVNMFRFAF